MVGVERECPLSTKESSRVLTETLRRSNMNECKIVKTLAQKNEKH